MPIGGGGFSLATICGVSLKTADEILTTAWSKEITMNALQTDLGAFRAGWESCVGESIAKLISGDIDDLRATGILTSAAKAGDTWPAARNLVDQRVYPFDLYSPVGEKLVIVTFYRGGWYPS